MAWTYLVFGALIPKSKIPRIAALFNVNPEEELYELEEQQIPNTPYTVCLFSEV